jgi:hypothetical protein
MENGFVQGENDLTRARIMIAVPPGTGSITLKRDDEQIRVWCSSFKEGAPRISKKDLQNPRGGLAIPSRFLGNSTVLTIKWVFAILSTERSNCLSSLAFP